jgi:hypothetical protein
MLSNKPLLPGLARPQPFRADQKKQRGQQYQGSFHLHRGMILPPRFPSMPMSSL